MLSPVKNLMPQRFVEALEDELRTNLSVHVECKDSICSLVNIISTIEPDTKSTLSDYTVFMIGPQDNASELKEQLNTIQNQEFFKIALAAIAKTFIINSSEDNPSSIAAFLTDGNEFLSSTNPNYKQSVTFYFKSEKLREIVTEVLDIS